jgi:hypothetical protein
LSAARAGAFTDGDVSNQYCEGRGDALGKTFHQGRRQAAAGAPAMSEKSQILLAAGRAGPAAAGGPHYSASTAVLFASAHGLAGMVTNVRPLLQVRCFPP